MVPVRVVLLLSAVAASACASGVGKPSRFRAKSASSAKRGIMDTMKGGLSKLKQRSLYMVPFASRRCSLCEYVVEMVDRKLLDNPYIDWKPLASYVPLDVGDKDTGRRGGQPPRAPPPTGVPASPPWRQPPPSTDSPASPLELGEDDAEQMGLQDAHTETDPASEEVTHEVRESERIPEEDAVEEDPEEDSEEDPEEAGEGEGEQSREGERGDGSFLQTRARGEGVNQWELPAYDPDLFSRLEAKAKERHAVASVGTRISKEKGSRGLPTVPEMFQVGPREVPASPIDVMRVFTEDGTQSEAFGIIDKSKRNLVKEWKEWKGKPTESWFGFLQESIQDARAESDGPLAFLETDAQSLTAHRVGLEQAMRTTGRTHAESVLELDGALRKALLEARDARRAARKRVKGVKDWLAVDAAAASFLQLGERKRFSIAEDLMNVKTPALDESIAESTRAAAAYAKGMPGVFGDPSAQPGGAAPEAFVPPAAAAAASAGLERFKSILNLGATQQMAVGQPGALPAEQASMMAMETSAPAAQAPLMPIHGGAAVEASSATDAGKGSEDFASKLDAIVSHSGVDVAQGGEARFAETRSASEAASSLRRSSAGAELRVGVNEDESTSGDGDGEGGGGGGGGGAVKKGLASAASVLGSDSARAHASLAVQEMDMGSALASAKSILKKDAAAGEDGASTGLVEPRVSTTGATLDGSSVKLNPGDAGLERDIEFEDAASIPADAEDVAYRPRGSARGSSGSPVFGTKREDLLTHRAIAGIASAASGRSDPSDFQVTKDPAELDYADAAQLPTIPNKIGAREQFRMRYRLDKVTNFFKVYQHVMDALEDTCMGTIPREVGQYCVPLFGKAELLTTWMLHGYQPDEICLKLRMCHASFFFE